MILITFLDELYFLYILGNQKFNMPTTDDGKFICKKGNTKGRYKCTARNLTTSESDSGSMGKPRSLNSRADCKPNPIIAAAEVLVKDFVQKLEVLDLPEQGSSIPGLGGWARIYNGKAKGFNRMTLSNTCVVQQSSTYWILQTNVYVPYVMASYDASYVF